MEPIDRCPVCSGDVITKEVEQLVRGGDDVAIVRVQADVCVQCGERLFSPETIRQLEEIQRKLERHETAEFVPLGKSYQVA